MSDLISRQKALDAFGLSEKTRKYGGDHSGYDTRMLYEIQDVLESLPSAEPERKWIPVTEALPKDMDRLLATIFRPDGEKRVRSGHYYKGYFMMDNGDTWNETDKGVLAWMPLVEPWEGDR